MYTGFNLTINDDSIFNDDKVLYFTKGHQMYKKHKNCTLSNLNQILSKNIIDGDALQNMWFPNELFQDQNFVFISHSHADKTTAIKLAGYLYTKFKIHSFIDSCIWGHIDKLNKILNNCDENKDGYCHHCECAVFSHNLSYVHIMLASALMTMIDKCECMFFLNTPSSINMNDKTESSWIYYELNIASIIQKKTKQPITESMSFMRRIEFTPNLKEMVKINEKILKNWECKCGPNDDPFDVLYKICEGTDQI